jgi:hypothetical protein
VYTNFKDDMSIGFIRNENTFYCIFSGHFSSSEVLFVILSNIIFSTGNMIMILENRRIVNLVCSFYGNFCMQRQENHKEHQLACSQLLCVD